MAPRGGGVSARVVGAGVAGVGEGAEFVWALVFQVPGLLVVVAGAVVAITRLRRAQAAAALALVGCGVLVLRSIMSLGAELLVVVFRVVSYYSPVSLIFYIVLPLLLLALGLALIILAAAIGRRPREAHGGMPPAPPPVWPPASRP
jgi:hypothetical protein